MLDSGKGEFLGLPNWSNVTDVRCVYVVYHGQRHTRHPSVSRQGHCLGKSVLVVYPIWVLFIAAITFFFAIKVKHTPKPEAPLRP